MKTEPKQTDRDIAASRLFQPWIEYMITEEPDVIGQMFQMPGGRNQILKHAKQKILTALQYEQNLRNTGEHPEDMIEEQVMEIIAPSEMRGQNQEEMDENLAEKIRLWAYNLNEPETAEE